MSAALKKQKRKAGPPAKTKAMAKAPATVTAKSKGADEKKKAKASVAGKTGQPGAAKAKQPPKPPRSVWPFDIGIVGLGIVGTHQITREAEQVIRRAKRTFVIESGYGITDYIKTLCPNTTNLGNLYERGKSRLPTYRKMAATVVAAAMEESPVCLAAYGHPWVYCYPTTLITRAASLLNLHVEVFPGISAFDTLLVDIGRDVAFDGVQMYEATDILLRRRPIQNDVSCVIWQSTIVGDPTYPDKPYSVDHFRPLQDYLMKFYKPNHEVTLVVSKTFPLLRSIVRRFPLKQLAAEVKRSPPLATIFIPPAFNRAIRDEALLKQMLKVAPAIGDHVPAPAQPSRPGRPVIGPQPPKRR
jgi:uncharacterized protein YabN with tetrapyrrole methylase and pyrophosphatase domain